jgi:hypothetical protein
MTLFLAASLLAYAAEHPELTLVLFALLCQLLSLAAHRIGPKAGAVVDAVLPLVGTAAMKALKKPAPPTDVSVVVEAEKPAEKAPQ